MRNRAYRRRFLKRDTRRSAYNGGFSPNRLWDRIHGNRWLNFRNGESHCDCESWHECLNREYEFRAKMLGCYQYQMWYGGNAPADFRRHLNRQQRAREKAALANAFSKGDWDDFVLPRYRHNANWNWW